MWPGSARVLFAVALTALASAAKEKIRICTTETAGFDMIDSSLKDDFCITHGCTSGKVNTKVDPVSEDQLEGFLSDLRELMFTGRLTKLNSTLKFEGDSASVMMKETYEYELVWYPTAREVRFQTRFGHCDIGWGPYTVDARRESCDATCKGHSAMTPAEVASTPKTDCCVDFGMPFLTTGVAVAYVHEGGGNIIDVFTSYSLIDALATLMGLLIFAAHVLWLCERNHNSDVFPSTYYEGIGAALWWSIVTVTTVGYGDKVPTSKLGRVVTAFFCVLIVTIFYPSLTGIVASELVKIQEPRRPTALSDFSYKKICTTELYAGMTLGHDFQTRTRSTVEECMSELASRAVDGVLHDKLMLNYMVVHTYGGRNLDTTPTLSQIRLSPVFPDDQSSNFTAADIVKHATTKEHYNTEMLRMHDNGDMISILKQKWFPDPAEAKVDSGTVVEAMSPGPNGFQSTLWSTVGGYFVLLIVWTWFRGYRKGKCMRECSGKLNPKQSKAAEARHLEDPVKWQATMEERQAKLEAMLQQQTDMLSTLLHHQGIHPESRMSRISHDVDGARSSREPRPVVPFGASSRRRLGPPSRGRSSSVGRTSRDHEMASSQDYGVQTRPSLPPVTMPPTRHLPSRRGFREFTPPRTRTPLRTASSHRGAGADTSRGDPNRADASRMEI